MLPSILPIQLLRTCVRLNAPIVRDARPRSAPAAIRWAAAFPSPPPRSQDKNRAQRRDGQTAKPVARPGCSIRSKTLYSPQSTQRAQRKHVSVSAIAVCSVAAQVLIRMPSQNSVFSVTAVARPLIPRSRGAPRRGRAGALRRPAPARSGSRTRGWRSAGRRRAPARSS